MRQYIQDVILKAIYIAAIVSIPPLSITFLFEESILRTFIAGPLVLLTTITIIYFIGLDKSERTLINITVKKYIKKIHL